MEEKPFEIYTSNSAATENLIKKEPVEMHSSDLVKTEIIIKNEHEIEINSADLNLNTITTNDQLIERFLLDSASQTKHKNLHVETYFSDSSDANECIMKKRSTMDLKLEDILNESSENDVFSEGDSDENNTKDVDMTKIKMEDIDIESNNIDVERNLTLEELKVENSEDENNVAANRKIRDCIEEDHTYAKKTQDVASQTDSIDNNRYEEKPKKLRNMIHDNGKFNCPQCQKVFTTKTLMDNHFLKEHDNLHDIVTSKIHSCNICNFKTTIKPEIFYHTKRTHLRLKKYQCNHCLRTFSQRGQLKLHILTVHSNMPHICKLCKERFNQKYTLDSHIVSRHQTNFDLMKTVTIKIYNCDHCTFKCVNNGIMNTHIKTHQVRQCPQCQRVFSNKVNVNEHMLRKHNLHDLVTSKIHSCNICSFQTTLASNLLEHTNRTHLRLKEYQCNDCLHAFVRKGVLKQHISSVHLNLRPYICEGCKKTFNKKQSLEGHIISCHQQNVDLMKTVGRKIYNCDHCTFKSVTRKIMNTHLKKKHQKKI